MIINEQPLKLLVSIPNEETTQCIFVYVPKNMCHINMSYERLNLPKNLTDRLDYWSEWYLKYIKETQRSDKTAFRLYGISLSIDLKLFLGNTYDICFDDLYGNKGQIEVNLKEEKNITYPNLTIIREDDESFKFA